MAKRNWPLIIAGTLGGLVVIGSCGAMVNPAPVPVPEIQSAPAAISSAPAPVPAPAPAPVEPAVTEQITDGTWIVGVDIEKGTYRSTGAKPSIFELCVWSTKDGASSNSSVIDLGTGNKGDRQVVEIDDSVKAFETSGCDTWTRVE